MCEMGKRFEARQEELMAKMDMFCDDAQKIDIYERAFSTTASVVMSIGLAKLLHPLMELLERTDDNEFDPNFIGEFMRLRMTFAQFTPISNAVMKANLRDICNSMTEVQITTMEALVDG